MVKEDFKVIVGMGETGFSVARHLSASGIDFCVVDDNPDPARLSDLQDIQPGIEVKQMDLEFLLQAGEVIVSPGVPLSRPEFVALQKQGIPITGDVAMFGDLARAPIIAITGSNGKSTVTSMVGICAASQVPGTHIAGNIGTPCLDVLAEDAQLYVLEISSFQLELATQLPVKVAVVLNLSPDHMDRYATIEDYYNVKANIYRRCEIAVLNRHINYEFETGAEERITFGSDAPVNDSDYGIRINRGAPVLYRGKTQLLPVHELRKKGRHDVQNLLASLAIGDAAGLDIFLMMDKLLNFEGLPHRCELAGNIDGVTYINDSKATNIGASISAIENFADGRNIILILGGESKEGDFSLMSGAVSRNVKKVLVFGRDKALIKLALNESAPVESCPDLSSVIDASIRSAVTGDTVLFSPACASFDMFESYQDRGQMFKQLVLEKSA